MSDRSPLRSERALAAASAVFLIVVALGPTAIPTATADHGDRITFDAGVPDEYEFQEPSDETAARIGDRRFGTLSSALKAANSGDVVHLRGIHEGDVRVTTPNVTLTTDPDATDRAVVSGSGEGTTLTVDASDVTIRDLWVRESGRSVADNDAAIWLNGSHTAVINTRVTDAAFGIWADGALGVHLENNTIVGHEAVARESDRGNGIQLWKVENATVVDNRITDVRDGIYYSWASNVYAANNTMWDLRYGVHYMYSDDCQLVSNVAFDNDVGFALMLSERLTIVDNVAVNNSGESGHGILVKRIDHSTIRGNEVVGNEQGLFVYNSVNDTLTDNLVMENTVGIRFTAGSVLKAVRGNSFISNGLQVQTETTDRIVWTAGEGGNYWSDARTLDHDDDGVSELRHRPAGYVERLIADDPAAGVFANSPAYDAIRRVEQSFPVIESPGIVDRQPLTEPPHDTWGEYYAHND